MSWEKEYNDPDILSSGVCWPAVVMLGVVFVFFLIKILFNKGVL